MSSRDEEKIKEMLKSVRPDYNKAALWDQLEDKLPHTEKNRVRSVWLFLLIGLLLGVGLSYTYIQFNSESTAIAQGEEMGSGAQNAIIPNDLSNLNNNTEVLDQKVRNTQEIADSNDEESYEVYLESSSNNKTSVLVENIVNQSAPQFPSSNLSSGSSTANVSLELNKDSKESTINRNFDQRESQVDADKYAQEVRVRDYSGVMNKVQSDVGLDIGFEESVFHIYESLPIIGIDLLASNTTVPDFKHSPILTEKLISKASGNFISVQTTSSMLFNRSDYSSTSQEWNSTVNEAVRPVWNQSINVNYERAIGEGWYTTLGVRTNIFTERLETVVENAHQPDVHYSDTAFYYQFDNGIINYYGGDAEYQNKEVRRVGQYNQSVSIGAQIGIKYIKSWKKWSLAPELGFYAMPYSFTSGKTLSSELDIVERSLNYRGFYGVQGQIAMEYQVNSRYRIFGGITYQSDLSNRLKSQSQILATSGLTLGTRVSL